MPMTQEYQTSSDWRAQSTLTVEQAAVILGIGRASAYAAAGSGDLPVIRLGRRLLVPTAQLRRLLGEDPNEQRPGGNQGVAEDSSRVGGQAPVQAA
jgi:excisionase family DNA binding protein